MNAFSFLCNEIDTRLARGESVRLILDGPCASGKTTLAARLSKTYDAPVIHMDDFYVPWSAKTPERLSQPGGNADWERFEQEVTIPLLQGICFEYRPFIPQSQSLGEPIAIKPGPLVILEGAYANHVRLRRAGNLRVKLTMPLDIRLSRLQKRDPDHYPSFLTTWIPLENLYFEQMAQDDSFDWILPGDVSENDDA